MEVMVHPVVASDGHTYEKKAILHWMGKHAAPTSPLTRQPLLDPLYDNHVLRRVEAEMQERVRTLEEDFKEREASLRQRLEKEARERMRDLKKIQQQELRRQELRFRKELARVEEDRCGATEKNATLPAGVTEQMTEGLHVRDETVETKLA